MIDFANHYALALHRNICLHRCGLARTFYPEGLPERDYLTYYATKFNAVEVDSMFYRTPSKATVEGWDRKTPPGFLFAAKVSTAVALG